MPNFKGSDEILLQPLDEGLQYRFEFTQNSSVSANDGYLPYNVDISSIAVTAHTEAGVDATSSLINGTPSVANNIVVVAMDYPGTEGKYHLRFQATLSNGNVLEADYNRIRAKNL